MPKTNTIADLDALRLRVAELEAERDEALTRAEAAECTLRAVCKALGADVDSAEAQAAALVSYGLRTEVALRQLAQAVIVPPRASAEIRRITQPTINYVRGCMQDLGLWRDPAAQEARDG